MKKSRLFFGLLLSALMIFTQLLTAFAEETLEQQLLRLQDQAYQQQLKTEEAQEKVDTVSNQLRRIQDEVDEAKNAYDAVKKELDEIEKQITENTELLEKTERNLEMKNHFLRKRLRNIYMYGQLNYLDVLLGATDFSDFMTRMDLLKRVIKYDVDLLKQVMEDREIILRARAELVAAKEEQEKLVQEAELKHEEVMIKLADKSRLMQKLETDRDMSERAYLELLAASREIESLIRQRTSDESGPRTVSGSGSMIWPLDGEITSEYGWRYHPIFGDSRFHSGLDIAGEYGLTIIAAASGTCIYSGWIDGYGYTIMIEHGGGLETLYAHNDGLLVEEGQVIMQGQAIAICGSTGNSTGPHCHFEVREYGETVSPYNYL